MAAQVVQWDGQDLHEFSPNLVYNGKQAEQWELVVSANVRQVLDDE